MRPLCYPCACAAPFVRAAPRLAQQRRPADAGRSVFVPATRRPSTTPIVSAKMETPAEALLTSPYDQAGMHDFSGMADAGGMGYPPSPLGRGPASSDAGPASSNTNPLHYWSGEPPRPYGRGFRAFRRDDCFRHGYMTSYEVMPWFRGLLHARRRSSVGRLAWPGDI